MSGEQVKVNGTWLAMLGGVGDLTWSTVADGGSEECSWTMDMDQSSGHPSLRAGRRVDIYLGSFALWSGTLGEPDHNEDGWHFTANGAFNEGDDYLCFDGSLNATATPDTAVDQAIARGLNWTRPASISATDFGSGIGETDALNYVSGLLDAYALSVSKRWSVNPLRQVVLTADPTTPMWHMKPGSGRIGLADDDYASDLYVRYRGTASTYATVHVADAVASATRRREAPVDATSVGVINSTGATNIGNGVLSRGKARYQWTDGLNPSPFQLTTSGGQPADLRLVRAQQMVRLHGVRDEQGYPLPYYDFVIGRTEYQATSRELQIAPVNLASRNLGDILTGVS